MSGPVRSVSQAFAILRLLAGEGAMTLSYQGALRLTHVGDSQAGENLIRRCKHKEACDGGSDWGSI